MSIPYSRYLIGSLPWYSVLMVSGIFIAFLLGTREEKRIGLPRDSMLDMVLVAVPSGIIGARLYYVAMTWSQFSQNPISILYIWEGGIAVYGSIIGGALGVFLYCQFRKRSFAALMDITAPGLVLAQAIGRWGNYFNREAYGPVIANKAWQFFPFGVQISQNGVEVWHVATFFYESMWDLGVFLVLWSIRKRVKRRGDLFLWYMALYGCGRFLVEQLRMDSLYLLGLRVSQYVSLLIVVAVAAVFLIRFVKQNKSIAILPACSVFLLAFARPLLVQSTIGVIITVILFVTSLISLWLAKSISRYALGWVAIDLIIYVVLLASGHAGWWQSPYFVYAGLSIPPYLAALYGRLPMQIDTAAKEVE